MMHCYGGAHAQKKSIDCFLREDVDVVVPLGQKTIRFEKKRKNMFGGFSTNLRGMSRWGDYAFELVGRVAFLSLFLVPSPRSCGSAVRSVAFETRPVIAAVAGLHRETPPRLALANEDSACSRKATPTPTGPTPLTVIAAATATTLTAPTPLTAIKASTATTPTAPPPLTATTGTAAVAAAAAVVAAATAATGTPPTAPTPLTARTAAAATAAAAAAEATAVGTSATAVVAAAAAAVTAAAAVAKPPAKGAGDCTMSNGNSASPVSPPTVIDAAAATATVTAPATAAELTTLATTAAAAVLAARGESEQGRVDVKPVASQPENGVKEECTPPDDGVGAAPRDAEGAEVANPAGTGSTDGSDPDGAAGEYARVPRVRYSPPSLSEWLKEGPFVLAMSPGFFGFYAHIGALVALEAAGLLEKVSCAVGASAGGLVAGLFASGMSPEVMGKVVVKFRRSDFWDPVGLGGLLRGKKFEGIVENTLPEGVQSFDQCRVPLAVSAFDVSRLTTRVVEEGSIAPALRATCTFPGLFAPVWHEQGVLVDGGIRDTTGMWCVPEQKENCRRVLNVTFGCRDGRGVCVPPSRFPTASNPRPVTGMEIASLALTGLPRPHPFAMERGAEALEAARSQVAAVLSMPLLAGHEARHWIAPTTAPRGSSIAVANGADGVGSNGKTLKYKKKNSAANSTGIAATVTVKIEDSGETGEKNAVLNEKPRLRESVKVEGSDETTRQNAVLNEKPRPQENAALTEKPRPTESRMAPPLDLPKGKKRRRSESGSCHDGELSTPTAVVSKKSDVSSSVANHHVANHGANRQGFPCEAARGGVTVGSSASGGCGGSSQGGGGKRTGEIVGTESAQDMRGGGGPKVWGFGPGVGRGSAGGGPGVGVTSAAKEEDGVRTAIEVLTPRRSKRIRTPKIPYTGS